MAIVYFSIHTQELVVKMCDLFNVLIIYMHCVDDIKAVKVFYLSYQMTECICLMPIERIEALFSHYCCSQIYTQK